ncbi:unnamed protein product, partial [Amoebophrya sp. A25]|eukprot:GSA25T00010980001.1
MPGIVCCQRRYPIAGDEYWATLPLRFIMYAVLGLFFWGFRWYAMGSTAAAVFTPASKKITITSSSPSTSAGSGGGGGTVDIFVWKALREHATFEWDWQAVRSSA